MLYSHFGKSKKSVLLEEEKILFVFFSAIWDCSTLTKTYFLEEAKGGFFINLSADKGSFYFYFYYQILQYPKNKRRVKWL